jgi:hypothetical protein
LKQLTNQCLEVLQKIKEILPFYEIFSEPFSKASTSDKKRVVQNHMSEQAGPSGKASFGLRNFNNTPSSSSSEEEKESEDIIMAAAR